MGDVEEIDKGKRRFGRKARERQTEIPGTERKRIGEIETAAERYCEVRDSRMELTEDEVKAKAKLLQLMHKHELMSYVTEDGHQVEREPGEENVKVKAPKKKREAQP